STRIDLPAPVSPVSTFIPGANWSATSSSSARPRTRRYDSMDSPYTGAAQAGVRPSGTEARPRGPPRTTARRSRSGVGDHGAAPAHLVAEHLEHAGVRRHELEGLVGLGDGDLVPDLQEHVPLAVD